MSHKDKKQKKAKSEDSGQDSRTDRPRSSGFGFPLFDQLAEGLSAPIEQLTGGTLGAVPQRGETGERSDDDAGLGLPLIDDILEAIPLGGPVGKLTSTAKPVLEPVLGPVGDVANAAAAPLEEGATGLGLGGITGGIKDLLGGGLLGGIGSKRRSSASGLRKRGMALIRLSQRSEPALDDLHPSFGRLVDELLPDEARILRFMGKAGTQPLLDVRTKTLFMIGSDLLLGDLSMVAEMAGCAHPENDRSYFANLHRLGLLEMSDEPVDDYRRYALLEVQPAAVHAIESVKKAHTVFRSIRVTAFGRRFIEMAFDLDGYNAGGWADDGRKDKYIGKRGPHGKKLAKTG